MRRQIKFLFISLTLCCIAGCERNKNLDIESLASGNYIIRVTSSPLGEPEESLRQRAAEGAVILCRRDGRVAEIKNIKIVADQYSNRIKAEAEFDCAPKRGRN